MRIILLLATIALAGCNVSDRSFQVKFFGDDQKAEGYAEDFISGYECPEGYALTARFKTTAHCRRVR